VSVLMAALEAALQQMIGNPALTLPKAGGMAGGLLSHGSHMAPPMGQVAFLEEEVEQWMEAGGLERLHTACHKV